MAVVHIEDGSRQVVRPTVGFGMLTCVFFLLKCCVSAEHANGIGPGAQVLGAGCGPVEMLRTL